FPVGESVSRSAIAYQLPIHSTLAHLVLKRLDFLRRNVWVIGSVQCQDLGLNLLRIARIGRAQTAMKTDHPGDFSTAPRQFENRCTPKAITDGGDALGVS